ncbi:MAG: FAD-dependent oxidoreductase [Planctomycetota bacterium]
MGLTVEPSAISRSLRQEMLGADLTVVGGGLAGTCCAITAARQGLRVTLIQDRPVLGGNASSEVRLWVLGATSHGNNNNRWAREGGVVDEFLCENYWRNPEGNPLIVDTILLEMVRNEPNVTLLLNTAVFEACKAVDDQDRIASVRAFCSQNSTIYEAKSPLFVDASGDGVLGFMAGAAFRMGAEPPDEFGESLAPDEGYGALLGHSIYFYSKDVGRPVRYTPPSYALDDITKVPRFRRFDAKTHGCRLWWIEYGGRLDTVHETEAIKWELWKVVYGVWDHIKNSGEFPEAETMTLEWVGTVPGKRESRRFEGDYMLSQTDLAEQRRFDDAVAFGGWAVDLHPADGVYSDKPGCSQFHVRGPFQIPYRCLYSRNVPNLFLAGRLISASHVAFGATRVMATCAHAAQAVAVAARVCRDRAIDPREAGSGAALREVRARLLRSAQHVPHVPLDAELDEVDLARSASIEVSSEFVLDTLPPSEREDAWATLDRPRALLMQLPAGPVPRVAFELQAEGERGDTEVTVELQTSSRDDGFSPDRLLARRTVAVGTAMAIDFGVLLNRSRAVFVCLAETPDVRVRLSDRWVTGVMAVSRWTCPSDDAAERHPGLHDMELWPPTRRPEGKSLACHFDPPVRGYAVEQLQTGCFRPGWQSHAWVADLADAEPSVTLTWPEPRRVGRIDLHFDTDLDHPMESVLMGHGERVAPHCVRTFKVFTEAVDGDWRLAGGSSDNRHSHRVLVFDEPVELTAVRVELEHPSAEVPAAMLGLRCYADANCGPVPPKGSPSRV